MDWYYNEWLQALSKNDRSDLEELGKSRFELKAIMQDGREYSKVVDGKTLYKYAIKHFFEYKYPALRPKEDLKELKLAALEYFKSHLVRDAEVEELPPIEEKGN